MDQASEGRLDSLWPSDSAVIPFAARDVDPSEQAAENEKAVLLPAAVAHLRPESQQLLRLWKDEGFSFEEIGRVTGQAPSTIRAR
jgi:DNA-directed RNA polymerase specialized sigma24 family protein